MDLKTAVNVLVQCAIRAMDLTYADHEARRTAIEVVSKAMTPTQTQEDEDTVVSVEGS